MNEVKNKLNIEQYMNSSASELTDFMTKTLLINDIGLEVDVVKGKKLRGDLVLLISDCLSGDRTKALEFASAVELIHQGSLEHDNVIDEHKERRGSIPLNLLKGTKFSVLAGDRCFSLAMKLASKSGNKEAAEVASAMESVLHGAMKEISITEFIRDVTSGEVSNKFYYKMIGLKTASLFMSAGRFGAMSATNSLNIIDMFGNYAHYVGVAFQIADDLTDIVKMGDGEKELDVGNIISVVPAVFNYNRNSVKSIPFMLMSGRISIDKVLDMISSIDMSGKMKSDINKNINDALNLIQTFEIQNEYTALLEEYPTYCVNKILSEVDEHL